MEAARDCGGEHTVINGLGSESIEIYAIFSKETEVKVDEMPMSKAPGMLKEKMAEAMKKDAAMEDEDMEHEMGESVDMEEGEDEEDDEYEGSSLMKRLKALKKG